MEVYNDADAAWPGFEPPTSLPHTPISAKEEDMGAGFDERGRRRNCDYCVSKKVKCKGGVPCTACTRKGLGDKCTFSTKRRPGPRSRRKKEEEDLGALLVVEGGREAPAAGESKQRATGEAVDRSPCWTPTTARSRKRFKPSPPVVEAYESSSTFGGIPRGLPDIFRFAGAIASSRAVPPTAPPSAVAVAAAATATATAPHSLLVVPRYRQEATVTVAAARNPYAARNFPPTITRPEGWDVPSLADGIACERGCRYQCQCPPGSGDDGCAYDGSYAYANGGSGVNSSSYDSYNGHNGHGGGGYAGRGRGSGDSRNNSGSGSFGVPSADGMRRLSAGQARVGSMLRHSSHARAAYHRGGLYPEYAGAASGGGTSYQAAFDKASSFDSGSNGHWANGGPGSWAAQADEDFVVDPRGFPQGVYASEAAGGGGGGGGCPSQWEQADQEDEELATDPRTYQRVRFSHADSAGGGVGGDGVDYFDMPANNLLHAQQQPQRCATAGGGLLARGYMSEALAQRLAHGGNGGMAMSLAASSTASESSQSPRSAMESPRSDASGATSTGGSGSGSSEYERHGGLAIVPAFCVGNGAPAPRSQEPAKPEFFDHEDGGGGSGGGGDVAAAYGKLSAVGGSSGGDVTNDGGDNSGGADGGGCRAEQEESLHGFPEGTPEPAQQLPLSAAQDHLLRQLAAEAPSQSFEEWLCNF